MNKSGLFLIAIIIATAINSYGVSVDTLYKVSTWKGNTDAAITYTFDDNLANQYTKAIPMFNEFGFHATFYPVINWSPNWAIFKTAADKGHEIGSHTVSHADLSGLSDALQRDEFGNSQNTINSNITGHKCLTIAYPFCKPGKDTITDNYYIAARHCQGVIENTTPSNFYAISSIVCGNQGSVKTTADFKSRVTSATASKGWVVYLIHALDDEAGYSPLSSAVLRESLEYLNYKRDIYWVGSFAEVVKYIKERNSASVEEIEANNDTIKVQVTDLLDDDIYNVPITILRELPVGWNFAEAYQGGNLINTSVKVIETVKYISFDAIPDSGLVTIIKAEIPEISKEPAIDNPYELATWKGFTNAAVTYTFDDNCPNQYSKAIPMFNEFNFKATFYPVINWSPNWNSFKTAADNGHEIGSHTISHPHLGSLSDSLQNIELANSQTTINSNISGHSCRTIAYPYCEPSADSITGKYFIAARHCQTYVEKTTPDDFFQISSIICGADGSIKTATDFEDTLKSASSKKGWAVYLIHAIDDDNGYSKLSSSVLRSSLEFLDTNRDTFWVSNFVNVARYIKERNDVSLKVIDVFTDSIQLEISDTLDNAIYNYPITFRRTMPAAWVYAKGSQNGDSIEVKIRTVGSKKYIEFNAVPDGGIVTIRKASLPVSPVSKFVNNFNFKMMPNPFSTELKIQAEGQFIYYIHSLDGRLMENGSFNSSDYIGKNLNSGVYILNIKNATDSFTTKIVKN